MGTTVVFCLQKVGNLRSHVSHNMVTLGSICLKAGGQKAATMLVKTQSRQLQSGFQQRGKGAACPSINQLPNYYTFPVQGLGPSGFCPMSCRPLRAEDTLGACFTFLMCLEDIILIPSCPVMTSLLAMLPGVAQDVHCHATKTKSCADTLSCQGDTDLPGCLFNNDYHGLPYAVAATPMR